MWRSYTRLKSQCTSQGVMLPLWCFSSATQSNYSAHRNAPRTSIHTSSHCFGKVVPRNLKGKSKTAQDWLTRQLNDPYVRKALRVGYRARSAFKLLELDERWSILRPGLGVVECGCAPGSWTQVVTLKCNTVDHAGDPCAGYDESLPAGRVVGVDLLNVHPLRGASFICGADFTSPTTQEKILELLKPHKVDLILSDMAPNVTGQKDLDGERILALLLKVGQFAVRHAAPGSCLLVKYFDTSGFPKFRAKLELLYEMVRVTKPPSSRTDSREVYLYASGFKGLHSSSQLKS